ncbi:hypothetical protein [Campylobacter cuniculorum]|uniref:Uncharacterized protein n=2 Tax=Campylobacter cuniculorum TaxID=374106 RepID=A0A1W6BVT2_9BACT|nr:hypothetical protein [Campylobacter cuniculorum]ARJ56165.1 hypothetical protein CCUN_0526 [Campylobacter cuniculorum DSM 23162 = LMG 24588]QOR03657.1 hypothetical protein A0071_05515 [Campylobacter cuniculorum]
MKNILLNLISMIFLPIIAFADITVSQQEIVEPHYEGCVLVYQYGADYSSSKHLSRSCL